MNRGVYVNNSNKLGDVSKRNLAKVLIDFMNLQTPEVQDAIARELCPEGERVLCDWDNDKRYFRITDSILNGYFSFNGFLKAMHSVILNGRNKGISYVGFPGVIENYKSLPENSNERKQNKYKGMINCCIKKGHCSDDRGIRNTFFGIPIGRQKDVEICTIGGNRRTPCRRSKRRTRRTRRSYR